MEHKVISIIGGTGQEGKALAKNWAAAGFKVVLGSRDRQKAEETAALLNGQAAGEGSGTAGSAAGFVPLEGMENREAVRAGRYIVLSVPYHSRNQVVESFLDELKGKILVDITVPLKPGKPPSYLQPEAGSSAEELALLVGDRCPIVSGFHTLGAGFLEHLYRHRQSGGEAVLDEDQDVFVCGDDEQAKQAVLADLVQGLNLRGADAGGLGMAQTLERLVPLLIGLNIRYKRKSTGIKLSGF